ncbi:MAG: hypothetical protein U9R20_01475 [Thermodesulfobacteriota bacterium]|nr:hypothetical protein [Thermodesulfobacteriota bacterium]
MTRNDYGRARIKQDNHGFSMDQLSWKKRENIKTIKKALQM